MKLQPLDLQHLYKSLKKKRCFSMKKAVLFGSRSGAFSEAKRCFLPEWGLWCHNNLPTFFGGTEVRGYGGARIVSAKHRAAIPLPCRGGAGVGSVIITILLLLTPLLSTAQTKEIERLADAAAKAARKGQLATADSLYQTYVDQYNAQKFKKGFDYSEHLGWLVRRAAQTGHVDRAIALQQEVVDIRRVAPDCNYAQWAAAMSDLASLYSQKGNYTQAIDTGREAVDMMRQKFGEKHHYYCIALANLASYYAARGQSGDYDEAVRLGELATKHMKHGTPEYANALNALVVFYTQAGRRVEANRLSERARKEARKRLEEDGVGYATVLNNQAIRLANAGNYDEAIAYATTARECFQQAQATTSLAYSKLLTNMGTFLAHQQRFDEAVQVLEEALPIIERAASRQHPDYVRCLSDLSSVYKSIGNLDKADQMAHASEQVSTQLGDQDNFKLAKSLSKQAATFASNGNYPRAIEHEQRALKIYTLRHDTVSMAFALGSLANYEFALGTREQALQTAEQALALFRQRGEQSVYYAQALNNAAILYFNNDDHTRSALYGRQALTMYEQLADTANTIYARIMANNGLFAFMNDSIAQAEAITSRAISLNQRILGTDHPDNAPLLYNLAVYQMRAGRTAEAEQSYTEALHLTAEQVRTNFLHLTSAEREKFWNRRSYIFRFAPLLAYQDRQNGAMAAEAYDALLFTKGILLNSDIDFKNLLKRTGDQQLLQKFGQLESLRQSEDDYYKLPAAQRDEADLRRIRENIYQLERALVRGCKEYGSFTQNLSITARQIAAALEPDEVAVEFADFYVHGMGNTYVALLLTPQQPEPRLIRLFSDDDLSELHYAGGIGFHEALRTPEGINQIYDDPRFGALVWGPILKALGPEQRRLYFSPTAMLYQMGIEYMPCDSIHRIHDRLQVYRLSSTKSLAQRQAPEPIRSATIYGGLNYDMSLAQLRQQHDQLRQQLAAEAAAPLLAAADRTEMPAEWQQGMQRALDSLAMRGSVHYLPGTLHEAQDIAEQLMQNSIATRVLSDEQGTEETFKALSGTSQSIIHIATHGFAFSEQEVKQHDQPLAFLGEPTADLDNTLNYSGLLFAGANYALQGNRLPADLDDGILTAREIAQIDLGQVEMVVLSACQTALGEIREDGVFGIQRGFKKAGAHSLLMSLWKVSDEATDLMMTHFYAQLMQGRSRQEAFRLAQEAVRQDPLTAAPYFWASFILLDAY